MPLLPTASEEAVSARHETPITAGMIGRLHRYFAAKRLYYKKLCFKQAIEDFGGLISVMTKKVNADPDAETAKPDGQQNDPRTALGK